MLENAVLITGGAGYIGSHIVLAFQESGVRVIVVDDLSVGRRDSVPTDILFFQGDAGDEEFIRNIIRNYNVTAVVHLAGSIVLSESISNPLKYYQNNTGVSRNLIQTCVDNGVKRFVFSSTAAVYGIPQNLPILESAATVPISPYGTSKLITEWMLRDAAAAHDFKYLTLRYFNVSGADPLGRAGQMNPNVTDLITVACQTAVGRRRNMEVFGKDHDTPDGTCIRDFIHISDLASAHVAALDYLVGNGESLVLNCGYGHGYSVHEVLAAIERQSESRLNIHLTQRRQCDVSVVVSDPTAIGQNLGWHPKYNDLDFIVRTALEWERKIASSDYSR